MKRKEFGVAINAIDGVSEIKGVKFAFTVLKNRKKLENQVEEDRPIFEEILKPSEGFKNYEESRIALCENHSEKNEDGTAKTEGDKYSIIDIKTFNEELENLTEEYKVAVDDRKKQIDEYNNLMEEDITIEFQKINLDFLPEDISESQLRSIEFMIDLD